MTSQARPIGAGALDPDPIDDTERTQPRRQREMPGRCRRERLDAEHTAVGVDDSGDVNVQMCIDTAVTGRVELTMVMSSLSYVEGWQPRPGKETV